VIRRVASYLARPEIRAHPILLVARRARYEGARWRGGAAMQRDRVVSFDNHLRLGVRFTDKIERTIYLYGVYEFHATRAFVSLVKPGATVVDGGAHVGHYTLLAATRVGETGRVISFEPDPRNRARLERNVALNNLTHVNVRPFALFDSEGPVPFAQALEGDTGTGTIDRSGQMTVLTVRLDDELERVGVERIDVVKLDLEGAEGPALIGARTLIERSHPAVLFEVNRIQAADDLVTAPAIEILREYGYRLYAVEPTAGSPYFALTELAVGADPRPFAERWYALNLVALHPDAHEMPR
jgi:FkbM family methyltransferase